MTRKDSVENLRNLAVEWLVVVLMFIFKNMISKSHLNLIIVFWRLESVLKKIIVGMEIVMNSFDMFLISNFYWTVCVCWHFSISKVITNNIG